MTPAHHLVLARSCPDRPGIVHADDARELVATGQDVERRVWARAVRWHGEHRVFVNGGRTVVFR